MMPTYETQTQPAGLLLAGTPKRNYVATFSTHPLRSDIRYDQDAIAAMRRILEWSQKPDIHLSLSVGFDGFTVRTMALYPPYHAILRELRESPNINVLREMETAYHPGVRPDLIHEQLRLANEQYSRHGMRLSPWGIIPRHAWTALACTYKNEDTYGLLALEQAGWKGIIYSERRESMRPGTQFIPEPIARIKHGTQMLALKADPELRGCWTDALDGKSLDDVIERFLAAGEKASMHGRPFAVMHLPLDLAAINPRRLERGIRFLTELNALEQAEEITVYNADMNVLRKAMNYDSIRDVRLQTAHCDELRMKGSLHDKLHHLDTASFGKDRRLLFHILADTSFSEGEKMESTTAVYSNRLGDKLYEALTSPDDVCSALERLEGEEEFDVPRRWLRAIRIMLRKEVSASRGTRASP
jgi:hypothetical protein